MMRVIENQLEGLQKLEADIARGKRIGAGAGFIGHENDLYVSAHGRRRPVNIFPRERGITGKAVMVRTRLHACAKSFALKTPLHSAGEI